MPTSTGDQPRLLPVAEVRQKRSPIRRLRELCRRASKRVRSRFARFKTGKKHAVPISQEVVEGHETPSNIQMEEIEARDEESCFQDPQVEETRIGENEGVIVDFSILNNVDPALCASMMDSNMAIRCFGSDDDEYGNKLDEISLELERLLLGSESSSASESEEASSCSSSRSLSLTSMFMNHESMSSLSSRGIMRSHVVDDDVFSDVDMEDRSYQDDTAREEGAEDEDIASQLYNDLLFAFSLKSEQRDEESDEIVLLNNFVSMITWSGEDADLESGSLAKRTWVKGATNFLMEGGDVFRHTVKSKAEQTSSIAHRNRAVSQHLSQKSVLARIHVRRTIRYGKKIGREVRARWPGLVDDDDAYQQLLPG